MVNRSCKKTTRLCLWLLLVLPGWLLPLQGQAARIVVSADRNPVHLNESFDLIFSADGAVDEEPDFAPLHEPLEILGQTQSSKISVDNGHYSRSQEWTLTVMAKRAGKLTIPPISFGRDRSQPLTLLVKRQPSLGHPGAQQDLFLEVSAEPHNPYVQAQVLYTVRVLRRTEIVQASLSEPQPDPAILQRLDPDRNYFTERNGIRYAVTERRYALFPQHSGTLVIPPVELNAQVVAARSPSSRFNGFFNRQPTRAVRLHSEALRLNVRPIPASFSGSQWLAAEQLRVTESWSEDPGRLKVGEPVTRTLTLTARGASMDQLPDLARLQEAGLKGSSLKLYHDQPGEKESKTPQGIVSIREQKTALIASRPGQYELAAIEIPWWNTATDRMEIARVAKIRLQAMGGSAPQAPAPLAAPGPGTGEPAAETAHPASPGSAASPDSTSSWKWLTAFLGLGWLVTLLAWALRATSNPSRSTDQPVRQENQRQAMKALKDACRRNAPKDARDALVRWAGTQSGSLKHGDPKQIAQTLGPAMQQALEELDRALYGPVPTTWDGATLWRAFSKASQDTGCEPSAKNARLEPLYP